MLRQTVVRVTVHDDGLDYADLTVEALVECLRHAGLIEVHKTASPARLCFDILPPHDEEEIMWAKTNAERMETLGFNAAVAPRRGAEKPTPTENNL